MGFPVRFGLVMLSSASIFGAFAGLAACDDDDRARSSVGTFDGSATDPDAAAGCGACQANACNAIGSLCFDDDACRALALSGRSTCDEPASLALDNCFATSGCSCARGSLTNCSAPENDAGELDAADAAPAPSSANEQELACRTCANGKCNDARRACGPETDCTAYFVCLFECRDEAGVTRCGNEHPTGVLAAKELATCTSIGCADACGL